MEPEYNERGNIPGPGPSRVGTLPKPQLDKVAKEHNPEWPSKVATWGLEQSLSLLGRQGNYNVPASQQIVDVDYSGLYDQIENWRRFSSNSITERERLLSPQGLYPKGSDPSLTAAQLDLVGKPGFTKEDYALQSNPSFDITPSQWDKKIDAMGLDAKETKRLKKDLKVFVDRESRLDAEIAKMNAKNIPREKWPSALKRKEAGLMRLSTAFNLAEKHGDSPEVALQFLSQDRAKFKNIDKVVKLLNQHHRGAMVEEIDQKLTELENQGLLKKGTKLKYYAIMDKLINEKLSIYNVGHITSLNKLFQEGLGGGDRASNVEVERALNILTQNEKGEPSLLEVGNLGKRDTGDLPKYTQLKLKGTDIDVEEAYLKFTKPNLFQNENIPYEWQDVAVGQYREAMSEIKKEFPNLTQERIEEIERKVTIDLYDFYFKYGDQLTVTKDNILAKEFVDKWSDQIEDLVKFGEEGK